MNRNQFFYTRTAQLETGETVSFRDSLTISKIVRSIMLEDGQVLILLDDIHNRMMELPVVNKKGEPALTTDRSGQKVQVTKKELQTVQTEIYLSPSDGERFFKLTNIEE